MAVPAIGMSVPGASALMPSPADQVAGETEEQRRKRLQALQASQTQPGASALMGGGYGNALPSSG
jgi:hypothetical protein